MFFVCLLALLEDVLCYLMSYCNMPSKSRNSSTLASSDEQNKQTALRIFMEHSIHKNDMKNAASIARVNKEQQLNMRGMTMNMDQRKMDAVWKKLEKLEAQNKKLEAQNKKLKATIEGLITCLFKQRRFTTSYPMSVLDYNDKYAIPNGSAGHSGKWTFDNY